jgi:cytochrome c oxidase cbb3-type subunit I/II
MKLSRTVAGGLIAFAAGVLTHAASANPQDSGAVSGDQPPGAAISQAPQGSAQPAQPAQPAQAQPAQPPEQPPEQPAQPAQPPAQPAQPAARAQPEQPAAPQTPPTGAQVQAAARGRKAFDRYCVSCHGVEGDGRGPSAEWLDPRPRVLTSGIFKFRSTPSGALPTDADLLRTITNGLHTTFMPRWAPTTAREREDLVQFVKTLSPRFASEPQGQPITIPRAPAFTPEVVQKGKAVWDKVQCAACHGDTGKGDGASARTLRDDWGFPIVPHDFTEGPLKVGDAPEDLYRAFMTGLNGTPMPSFAETLSPDDAWALVAYVRTLRKH